MFINSVLPIFKFKLTIMKKINNNLRALYLVILSVSLFLTACNKDLEQFAPIAKPVYPSGAGIAGAIAANVNDSLYNRIIIKTRVAEIILCLRHPRQWHPW